MSRSSDAKKARRKKRQSARDSTWMQPELDEIGEAVAVIDEWIAGRGWVLDTENAGDHLVSWVYPPSAAEFDDAQREPVTRIWIVVEEDDDALELAFGAALVGGADSDGPYLLDPQTLPDDIAALESYRPGQPLPVVP